MTDGNTEVLAMDTANDYKDANRNRAAVAIVKARWPRKTR